MPCLSQDSRGIVCNALSLARISCQQPKIVDFCLDRASLSICAPFPENTTAAGLSTPDLCPVQSRTQSRKCLRCKRSRICVSAGEAETQTIPARAPTEVSRTAQVRRVSRLVSRLIQACRDNGRTKKPAQGRQLMDSALLAAPSLNPDQVVVCMPWIRKSK